ncbi:hypothetical protein ADUPG1_007144 [Aduncisulcus paluster]|uniref:Uncharacterized protein n=1 Tax=Aduncisulcus paluster TaxID=2918883 RepID=A0ABQ5KKV9_9EUKA|nr:hypothetical protein ADUPG1_007144 [Aduncisulcus paluster]
MNVKICILFIALLGSVLAVSIDWGNSYHVDAVLKIPNSTDFSINEEISYDFDLSLQSIKYSIFDDLDFNVWVGSKNYDVYVAFDHQECTDDGSTFADAPVILPDMSVYTATGETPVIEGIKVNKYVYEDSSEFDKPQTYTMYITEGGTPVQWHMTGYNLFSGSHYDQYIIDYISYTKGSTTAGAFDVPAQCANMTSSSRGISGSAALLRSLMTHKAVCEIDASDVRFAAYSRRFAKKYASLEERTERQRLFSRRYAMIEKHNANTENTFTMAINKFADLTLDEIHKIYTGFRPAYRREGDEDHGNAVCEIDASDVRFAAYSRRFAKKYASLEERTERQRLFSRRYAMIEKHNVNTENTFTMAINKFADLTLDEIHKIYTGFRPAYRREGDEDHGNVNDDPFWHSGQFTHLIDHTPETVSDWRTIDWRLYSNTVSGTVNDQGNCGSCWAFSAVNALEGRLAKKLGEYTALSQQFVVNCAWATYDDHPDSSCHGCDGGDFGPAYDMITDIGIVPEADVPYRSVNDYCDTTLYNTYPEYALTGWGAVDSGNKDDLYNQLLDGPVAISIAVPESLVFYAGGIYNDPDCGSDYSDLAHGVTLEGWGKMINPDDQDGDEVEYWIVKNSWSALWGVNGYVYIDSSSNFCGVLTNPAYAILE